MDKTLLGIENNTKNFSLPKTKKTTQPIENKETVIKMNSKKTTKK